MPDGLNSFDKSAAPAVNTSNPESAAKALMDIREYAKQAHAAGEDMGGALEKVQADLSKALRQVDEMRAASAPATSEEDMSLKAFKVSKSFRAEGKSIEAGEVLLRGRFDDRTKQFRPGLLDQTSHVGGDWAKDLRKAVGDLNIVSRAKGGARNAPIARARVSDLLEKAPASVKGAPSILELKAFVDNPTGGGEWIIDMGIPDLIQNNPLIRSALVSRLRVHQMAAKEEVIPALLVGLRPQKSGTQVSDDPAAYTSSSLETGDRRRTVGGMTVLTKIDREAAEDAILSNIGELLRREVSLAIRDGEEDAVINGDTAASHQDTIADWDIANRWGSANLGGANDHRRAFDGFRKYCLNTTVGGVTAKSDLGSSQTFDGFVAAIGGMTGTGGGLSNTLLVVNKKYLFSKLMLMEEFKKAYILGRAGTADRAELANFAGWDLYVSDFMDKKLAATGLYTDGSTSKTGMLAINLDDWEMNERLGTVVEMDTDITRNQNLFVARVRRALWSREAAGATAKNMSARYFYNLDA